MKLEKLLSDDAGFIVSAELVLVATIVVIGMITGLAILRNQVSQELTDVAMSVGSMSQSYAIAGTQQSDTAWTDGSGYKDLADSGQAQSQAPGSAPSGINMTVWPSSMSADPTGGEGW